MDLTITNRVCLLSGNQNTGIMSPDNEKILCLHPQGKNGVNISRKKYDVIKDFILQVINDFGEISYKDFDQMGNQVLKPGFSGSVSWYIVTVKLDLEARGIIMRENRKTGHFLKLKPQV